MATETLVRSCTVVAAWALLTVGCSGHIDPTLASPNGEPTGALPGGDGGVPTKPGSPDEVPVNTAPPACSTDLLEARAVLVTPRQYVNVLRDLFGKAAVSDADADADAKLEFETVDRPPMTTATMDRVMRLAETATKSLRGKPDALPGCTKLDDAACVRGSLAKLGARAFKRPLETTELDGLIQVYQGARDVAESGEDAALLAVQALLISPSTLYRTEFLGAPSKPVRDLTQHERAGLLGSLLLDSLPDEGLLAAAEANQLGTAAQLDAQVERLLALPRVQTHVTRLLLSAFNVTRVFEQVKETSQFPEFNAGLQGSMYEESRRFVEDILWSGKRPLTDLLSSRDTFVDPALAKLYGVPYTGAGKDFVKVQLPPERSGLLTQASVMTVLSRTEKTSVVARGLFVRGALLCLSKIPAPPASVQAQITAQLEDTASERDLAAYRAKTSPCNGCHAQFDRLGLILEGFDAVGRRHAAEEMPLDLTGLGNFQGNVANAAELATQVVEGGEFERCLSQRVYAYAQTTPNEVKSQACIADALQSELESSDGSMRSLVSAIVHHPDFFRRSTLEN